MCGIIGILAKRPVAPLLLDGLKRLEYRGYDSAGIATIERFPKSGNRFSDKKRGENKELESFVEPSETKTALECGKLVRSRAQGKLVALEEKLAKNPHGGSIGIGHTRWATHGAPSVRNAHPHMTAQLALVHNGIIENFAPLRDQLSAKGYHFESETDTEVAAHLISDFLQQGHSPLDSVKGAMAELQGAFALALIFSGQEDLMIAARQGPPLVIGHGTGPHEGEAYVGSDAIALAPFTNRITYLEDGDIAVLTHGQIMIYDKSGQMVSRAVRDVGASFLVSKGTYRHFMLKEIFEQPEIVGHTLAHYLDLGSNQVRLSQAIDWKKYNRLSFACCGTAFYAALVARYWFEHLAGLAVDADVASEFRYREPPLEADTLCLFVSQSGETADTLACLRYCQTAGCDTAAIVNVEQSTMAREADFLFPTLAGPEIGVASTKAFTAQLVALAALALEAGRARGKIDDRGEQEWVRSLAEIPRFINQILKLESTIEHFCRELVGARHVLYLGRGSSYPIALEGALKLKELSYIHAEGYAAGELKHGPIALIDETMPVIVIAPYDRWFDKTVSNMQEVAARGGRILLITDEKGAGKTGLDTVSTLIMPEVAELISPILYAIPVQLVAYHTALALGTDVDQPRNLAKSVTVE